MAYVRLDSSILELPDDGGPWGGMGYQEIADAQAARVAEWNARLAAEIERQKAMPSPPEREVMVVE